MLDTTFHLLRHSEMTPPCRAVILELSTQTGNEFIIESDEAIKYLSSCTNFSEQEIRDSIKILIKKKVITKGRFASDFDEQLYRLDFKKTARQKNK